MKRILVIGCCGSGKSTLAQELSAKTKLPLVHLDRVYWQSDWKLPERNTFHAHVSDLVHRDTWIMDGHYISTMPIRLQRADTIFHLDFPTRICMYRILKRTVQNYGKDRPDCAKDCPERFSLSFMRHVWNYRKQARRKVIALLDQQHHLSIHTFERPKDVRRFLLGMN